MSYTYSAGISVNDADGRSVNLNAAPTITVWDFDSETQITTPAPTLVNFETGFYKVKITIDTKTTVAFKIVPHVDDQSAVEDIKVMQVKAELVADDIEGKVDIIDGVVDDIKTKTDELTFTTPNRVDALAEVDAEAVADAIAPMIPTPENVWTHDDRSLTMSATEVIAAVSGSSITQVRGNTWAFEIPNLTLSGDKQQFAIKRSPLDTDDEALLFIDTVTGLVTVNGAPAEVHDKASLSYAGTTLTVTVDADITAELPVGRWHYGIQSITTGGVVIENYTGAFVISPDIVRATN